MTVTVGGNDLMSTYGDTQAARNAIGRVTAVREAILVRLRALCGDTTPIVVTTVYDPATALVRSPVQAGRLRPTHAGMSFGWFG